MSNDSLSEEEKNLFRQMMKDVTPLRKTRKVDLPAPKPGIALQKRERLQHIEKKKTDNLYLSDFYLNEVSSNSTLSYCSHSIPNKRLRELKNGQIPWQARLDLHGLKPDVAREALLNFIIRQSALARRCLLIIHGKGGHNGKAPVLKNLVNHWLPQFPQILAFHSALPKDGGDGALYLLLKRQKEETN